MTCTHCNTSWTDEHIAELRRLNSEGKSDSQIARAMAKLRPGLTKNGVVSLRHRLGIASRSANFGGMSFRTKAANAKASASRAVAASAKSRNRRDEHSYERVVTLPAPPPAEPVRAGAWTPLSGTKPRPLLEHSSGQCSWPVIGASGETLFCCVSVREIDEDSGVVSSDGPYCAAHRRMAYVPVKRRAA